MGHALTTRRRITTVVVSAVLGFGVVLIAANPASAAASECDAVSGNLVQNCGFELDTARALNSLPDWTIGGLGTTADVPDAHSGAHAASLAAEQQGGAAVTVSQTVPTVAGTQYTFSYWLEGAGNFGGAADWVAVVSGGIGGPVNYDLVAPAQNVWTQYTHTIAAAGSSITISFSTHGIFANNNLDDVSVVANPDLAQMITFGAGPTGPIIPGDTFTVTATGGASGNPVVFSTLNLHRCNVTSIGAVTFKAPGDCVVDANQAGGVGYAPAPTATLTIRVLRTPQTIIITSTVPSHAVPGTPYTVTTNGGGTSGNPVTFSTATASTCTVDATTGAVTLLAKGWCTIKADQAGTRDYAPAPTARQTIRTYAR